MKKKILTKIISLMTGVFICLISLSFGVRAQNTASASNDTKTAKSAASSDQDTTTYGGYEIKSSIELGIRGLDVNGNDNKYRSDLNYRAGFRFFDSSFLATAKDGSGKPFDTFLVTGSGWNADPSGYTRVNVEKTGWYRFDANVRRFAYFNNLVNLAENSHIRDSKHTMGDFDITILPQNEKIKFRFGYSFDRNNGFATTTYHYQRDDYTLSSDIKTQANDVRFGIDAKLLGFNLSFTEGYRRFKDNTTIYIPSPQLGYNPTPNSSLTTFSREMPDTGRTFYHRFGIHRTFAKKVDFTGRFIYTETKSKFNFVEKATGLDSSGNPIVLDKIDVNGEAKRPNVLGDLGLTFFVTDKFSISNTFSANAYRISGGNAYLESLARTNPAGVPLATQLTNTSAFALTNYRRYMNTIEGDYSFNRRFSFYLGYRYTNRKITLSSISLSGSTPTVSAETGDNNTNSILAGFKAQPVKKIWTMNFDLEHGTTDNVFTRLANYDFTNIRFRNRIRATNNLSLNFSIETKDNSNPSRIDTTLLPANTVLAQSDVGADIKTRIFSGSFDWTVSPQFTLDGGYTYNNLTSKTTVIFPVNRVYGLGLSNYMLRSNYAFIDAWFQPHKRVSAFVSYRITKDTGNGNVFDPATYLIVGNYPLRYQSPEVRLIFKINKYIDWNVGYQYYNYQETPYPSQNYSSHMPYTSLRIYFGRKE